MKNDKLRTEYNKQLKRIKSYISRQAKKGILISKDIIPDRPKRITQGSVNRLAKLTPEKLKKQAVIVDIETGEIISEPKRKLKRVSEAEQIEQLNKEIELDKEEEVRQQKRKESLAEQERYRLNRDDTFWYRTIIDHTLTSLISFPNAEFSNTIIETINKAIDRDGVENVAKALDKMHETGHALTYQIAYNVNDLGAEYISDFNDFLYEMVSDEEKRWMAEQMANVMEDSSWQSADDDEIPF